jgi:hypothetical protein
LHNPTRRSTIIGLGLGVAGALTGVASANAAPKNTTTTSTTAPTPAPATHPLRFGLINPGGPLASKELDKATTLTGERPALLGFFKDFRQAPPITELDAVLARGATPILAWEPWAAGAGVDQPAYSLAAIADGAHDGYLKSWGNALAKWGKPVMLRFAHEMNGDWYPWSEAVNGNSPGDYVRAWRHVHDVLTAQGATNVRWVWAINAGGPVPVAGLYPGHDYVDVLGLDGYNWGTVGASWGSNWTAAAGLFGPWLDRLRSLAAGKEIIITETASTELGGSKAEWIRDTVAYLDAQPDVTGFVWFDMTKETDWRIASSTASSGAFKTALSVRE